MKKNIRRKSSKKNDQTPFFSSVAEASQKLHRTTGRLHKVIQRFTDLSNDASPPSQPNEIESAFIDMIQAHERFRAKMEEFLGIFRERMMLNYHEGGPIC